MSDAELETQMEEGDEIVVPGPRDRVIELSGLLDDAFAAFLARGRDPQTAFALTQLFVQSGCLRAAIQP